MTQARPTPEEVKEARLWLRAIKASPHWPEEDKQFAHTLLSHIAALEEDRDALEVEVDVREAEVKELRNQLAQEPDWKQRALNERVARVALEAREKEAGKLLAPVMAAVEAEAAADAAAGNLRPPYQPYGVPPAALFPLAHWYRATFVSNRKGE